MASHGIALDRRSSTATHSCGAHLLELLTSDFMVTLENTTYPNFNDQREKETQLNTAKDDQKRVCVGCVVNLDSTFTDCREGITAEHSLLLWGTRTSKYHFISIKLSCDNESKSTILVPKKLKPLP